MLRLFATLGLFGALVVAGNGTADDPAGAKKDDPPDVKKKADSPDPKKKDEAPGAKKRDDPPDAKKKGPPAMTPETVFKQMDANGDGKVSKDEFKDFMGKIAGGRFKNRPFLLDKLFERADADGDGYLSLEEVKEVVARLRDRIGNKLPLP
jgi:hypothetical protein